jgi:hypothetical protein
MAMPEINSDPYPTLGPAYLPYLPYLPYPTYPPYRGDNPTVVQHDFSAKSAVQLWHWP